MKKTVKSIIATILALTLAFCSIPAFAFQYGEIVGWEDEIGTYLDPYAYTGEMTEGTAYYEAYERANCCKLNLEKEGFYLFSYDAEKVTEIEISSSVKDGYLKGWEDVFYSADGGKAVAYITDEETYAGFSVADGVPGAEITVSYYDSAIADIEFEDGVFDELIFAADFRITEKENVVKMRLDAEINFENGDVFTVTWGNFEVEADEAIGRGKYNATVNYYGYSEEAELDVRLPSDYIAKVEIENLERYLNVTEYYDGRFSSGIDLEKFKNEKVTITYHDGTTDVIERHEDYNRYSLPNGRNYDVWYEIVKDGEEFYFVFRFAGQNFAAKKCESRKAVFIENLIMFNKFVGIHTDRISYWLKDVVFGVAAGNLPVETLLKFFTSESVRASLGYIFEEIGEFTDYYTK